VKNPDYWKTTTIDGSEFQLPFVDRIEIPIIPDDSVQVSALRTGQLDYHQTVPFREWGSLAKTNPELLSARALTGSANVLVFNTQEEGSPVQNREVRRALMVGIDRAAIDKIVDVEKPVHWWPGGPDVSVSYTPLEDMPEETRLLYDYNPELAKKMLADAGYPDGFKLSMKILVGVEPAERASLIQAQWAKLGVDLVLETQEPVEYTAQRYALTYGDSRIDVIQCQNPAHLYRWAHSDGALNYSGFSNGRFDELTATGLGMIDDIEANTYFKEAAVVILNEAPIIPLDATIQSPYWWPWLKNYYGETNVQDAGNVAAFFAYMWIDKGLKKEMGY
jgi:peptide/nickel transport system substrate-binding protein